MNRTTIVHPRLLTSLGTDFYPSTGTVQEASQAADSAGQLIPTWANLAAHEDLACAIASVSGQETETASQVYVLATHKVSLRSYYPDITEDMRFVSDGVAYDIERVHHDQLRTLTYLDVQVVT